MTTAYTHLGGKYVEAFEQAFATKYDVKHCISCASGTDAIYISLKAVGIGPGDEVLLLPIPSSPRRKL
jgi:Predicted pyridoxal phosphate-dependent enzyme apparently involved in regulation of cell wall biogenesis